MEMTRSDHKLDTIADEQLMVRIGDRDRVAYKVLVDRHLRNFMAFAVRINGDRSEAEDIMQEAFMRVWNKAVEWDQNRHTRFTTWFYRIVLNLSIDVKRKKKSTSELSEAMDIMSNEMPADAVLSEKQMAFKIAEVMMHLPKRQRIAVSLCYLQELGNQEAAKIMDITTPALESLLVRGRRKMAELLDKKREEFLKDVV
ncbi:MAG: sigma-70 family RNA polymerase sigma factor [Emcibacter sp.]|nr:sigma-70 family RNA polymerase sigma factor [Emcibacter sp.]